MGFTDQGPVPEPDPWKRRLDFAEQAELQCTKQRRRKYNGEGGGGGANEGWSSARGSGR